MPVSGAGTGGAAPGFSGQGGMVAPVAGASGATAGSGGTGSGTGGTTAGAGGMPGAGGASGSGGMSGTGGMSGGGGASGTGGDPGAMMCKAEPVHMGGLTQYDQTPLGNCGMPWPSDDLYGAMATADYGASAVCGMCAEVTGPTGQKTIIHAVDQCPIASNPKCVAGHIDLSHTAYQAIVPSNYQFGGEVPNSSPISWHYVACNTSGPIVYHFKDGTSVNWLAVQIRNSRYGIASLQYRRNGGAWENLSAPTGDLAYYVANGPNTTTYDFRVTDVNGQVLEDDGLQLMVNGDVSGHAQFPTCR